MVLILLCRDFASGLPAQITAGINIGLSGMPFSGSDIGGFEWYVDSSPPDLELWSRWTEAGCFSGLMHEQGIANQFSYIVIIFKNLVQEVEQDLFRKRIFLIGLKEHTFGASTQS